MELDFAGFLVWRGLLAAGKTSCSLSADDYTDIRVSGFIDALGDGSTYTYLDSGLNRGETFCYALEEIDLYGDSSFHLDLISTTPNP